MCSFWHCVVFEQGIDLETEVAYDYEENSDGLALKASLVESAGGVLTRNVKSICFYIAFLICTV